MSINDKKIRGMAMLCVMILVVQLFRQGSGQKKELVEENMVITFQEVLITVLLM